VIVAHRPILTVTTVFIAAKALHPVLYTVISIIVLHHRRYDMRLLYMYY